MLEDPEFELELELELELDEELELEELSDELEEPPPLPPSDFVLELEPDEPLRLSVR